MQPSGALCDQAALSVDERQPLVEGAAAVGCAAAAGQLVVTLLLLEAVVVGQFLARLDVNPSKEHQAGGPVDVQHLRVHAWRAAVVLQTQYNIENRGLNIRLAENPWVGHINSMNSMQD